jgi:cytochrome c oxidase subunit I+III
VDIGAGIRVPVYATGPSSHSWWATVILMLVAGTIFACLLFSYLYLWTVSPQVWPSVLPPMEYPFAAGVLLVLSSAAVAYANKRIYAGFAAAIALLGAAFAVELYAHRALDPAASSYGALVYAFIALQGFYVVAMAVMALYTLARRTAGLLDRERRATLDCTILLWHYTVAQGVGGLIVVHGFPRVVG